MEQVDLLRGLAALSVALFHFTSGNAAFLSDCAAKRVAGFGFLGVQVFFVISGFIIPFAMWRADYRLPDCGRFLLKRIIRLDPPYLAAILLIIVLNALSALAPGFQGKSQVVSVPGLLAHLGYVNVFFGYPWLNPVFWTLAVEVQYYFAVALVFPLITHPRELIRIAGVLGLIALGFLPVRSEFLTPWLPLFALGITAFLLHAKLLARASTFLCAGVASAAGMLIHGALMTGVAISAAAFILCWRVPVPRPLLLLGAISYSLYLVHVPLGGRVVNLSLRFVNEPAGKFAVVAVALALSLLAAWVLYRLIELPAQRWASRIGYKQKAQQPVALDTAPSTL